MIVITAASGHLGQAVAHALEARIPVSGIRLAARSPDKLAAFRARGFEVVQADYEDPASLRVAFEGADSVAVISSGGVDADRIRHHTAAIEAVKAAGVPRIVYTSSTNPVPASRFEWAGAHCTTEALLRDSGLDWTVLRDNAYASNNDGIFDHAVREGVFAIPGPDAHVAWVTHEDVADALAVVLTTPGHAHKVYEITGPTAPDSHEVAAMLAKLSGRAIRVVDVPLEVFAGHLRSAGLPEFVVTGVTSFYAALGAGEYAAVSKDVERLAGHPGTTIGAYLERFVRERG